MRITLNGTPIETPAGGTIAALVATADEWCAVAVNGEVVPRSAHDRRLVEGDRVEIVTAVAGG